jgi:ABC-type glutathione transport system ATPase component
MAHDNIRQAQAMSDAAPIMQLRNVKKTFGRDLVALRSVNLDLFRGRVHGLLGGEWRWQIHPHKNSVRHLLCD